MQLTRLVLCGLAVSALGCGSTVVRGEAPQGLLYLVVHPSDGPGTPGIYEYDIRRDKVLAVIPLPGGLASPQALAYDGASLWLSGIGDIGEVFRLDPATGAIRADFILPDNGATGIAATDMTLWTIGQGPSTTLRALNYAGEQLQHQDVTEHVADLATDGEAVYVLADIGKGANAIERFDMFDGSRRRLAEMSYLGQSRSALTYDGKRLVTVESSMDLPSGRRDRNALRWIDPAWGETIDQRPISVRGWITAIAARSDAKN
jgi:hypothetical protein